MAARTLKQALPLVVIVGPTASGKSAVAIEIAKRIHGEIICADSRTVYREASVGTAKPTLIEQQGIPHYGLDLVDPGGVYSAADFKSYANTKIREIRQAGAVPILVGGTGLYIDAVIFDYQFGAIGDIGKRRLLEERSLDELVDYCIINNINLPENSKNKRYVMRAIEQGGINQKRSLEPIPNTIIVGIATDAHELRARIAQRCEQMFENGIVEEATKLGKIYGWNAPVLTGNIYRLVHKYIEGSASLEETKRDVVTLDCRLAKRQRTWFRRNTHIVWLQRDQVVHYLECELAKPV